MYDIVQSTTTYPLYFLLVESADHITPLTGASPTVTICKNGGSFGSPSGAVSEVANGWYKVAGNATDTATIGPLLLHATAASADPSDSVYNVVSSTVTLAASQIFVKKNTILNNFEFLMTDVNLHTPKTGLTITSQVSIDGGAFAATANSASEISNGIYKINLAAADTNGTVIMLLFTATGADNRYVSIITQ